MEMEESGRERLTIQCGMARLPILEEFVSDLGPALRVCRPALAIEERLKCMKKRFSVIEEAVSAHLPTSLSPPSPAAPAQDHPLSQAPQSPQRGGPYLSGRPLAALEALISWRAAPMVAANSAMAGAFEFIKEIMGTACTHHSEEHPTLPPLKRMSSGQTSEESTTT